MSEYRFLYFLSGLGIGVAAGLFWAPKSGAETIAAIKESAIEGGNLVKRQGNEIRNTVGSTIERGKHAAKITTDGVIEALEQGKAAFSEG